MSTEVMLPNQRKTTDINNSLFLCWIKENTSACQDDTEITRIVGHEFVIFDSLKKTWPWCVNVLVVFCALNILDEVDIIRNDYESDQLENKVCSEFSGCSLKTTRWNSLIIFHERFYGYVVKPA